VVKSTILFIHTDRATMDIVFLYVATRSRGIKEIAEPSRLAASIVSMLDQWSEECESAYPMTQVSLAALDALTRNRCPPAAVNPSTPVRDVYLQRNAEEVRMNRFGARLGYILKQRHTRDLPATTTTEQTHAVNDESRGVR